MTALTVLYDPTCGLCRRAHEWLAEQRKLIELIFVPCKSEEARLRFPHLDHDLTARDLTVIGDQGEVYMGPKAWLMVIWAVSRMVLPALLAGVVADYTTRSLDDLSASISNWSGHRSDEVKL